MSVLRSGGVAVTEEVIQSVTVELTADQLFHQRARGVASLQQIGNGVRRTRRIRIQALADVRMAADQAGRPVLVPQAKHLFPCVAQRTVAEVMQEGRGIHEPTVDLEA